MPRLFTKTTTINSIPIEIGCEHSEDGQHRIYVYVDGVLQGDAILATDANLESVLVTAETNARHKVAQARLGVMDSEAESVKLLRKLGFVEKES